jgi:hypothetical protein
MTPRRKREAPPAPAADTATDAVAAALQRGEHDRIAWLVLDAALEAVNVLGAATIDEALALFDREEPRDDA